MQACLKKKWSEKKPKLSKSIENDSKKQSRTEIQNWPIQQEYRPKREDHQNHPKNKTFLNANPFWFFIETKNFTMHTPTAVAPLIVDVQRTFGVICGKAFLHFLCEIVSNVTFCRRVVPSPVAYKVYFNFKISELFGIFLNVSHKTLTLVRPHPMLNSFVPGLTSRVAYLIGWTFSLNSISPYGWMSPISFKCLSSCEYCGCCIV